MKRASVFACSLLVLIGTAWVNLFAMQQLASGTPSGQTPDLDTIVARMEQRQAENRASAPPLTVVREYQLYGDESEKAANSAVTARINLLPPNKTSYQIIRSEGSGRGITIVQHVLDSETEMRRDPENHSVNRQNYKFTFAGEKSLDGRNCYVLDLEPQRKSQDLIHGQVWIDAATYQVRMIDGEPSKSPSWWVKKLHVNIRYGDLDGVWTSQATRAVAEVHLFGKHIFTSRAVSGSAGIVSAANRGNAELPQRDRFTSAKQAHRNRPLSSIPAIVGADVPLHY